MGISIFLAWMIIAQFNELSGCCQQNMKIGNLTIDSVTADLK